MSIAELKAEVANLSKLERKELAAYLSELERLFPPGLIEELSTQLDDKNPNRWVPLEEAKKQWRYQCNRIETSRLASHTKRMSIAELKAEVDRLSPEERKQLGHYIAAKSYVMTDELRKELTEKINDKNPARWIPLEEAEKMLFPEEQS